MPRAKQIFDGEWIRLTLRGERIMCCDCSLTHDMDFKIERRGKRSFLYARLNRHPRSTANGRRAFNFTKDDE